MVGSLLAMASMVLAVDTAFMNMPARKGGQRGAGRGERGKLTRGCQSKRERNTKGQPNKKESDENRLGCIRIVGRNGRKGYWRGKCASEHAAAQREGQERKGKSARWARIARFLPQNYSHHQPCRYMRRSRKRRQSFSLSCCCCTLEQRRSHGTLAAGRLGV